MPGSPSLVGYGFACDAITGRVTLTARAVYLALLTAAPTSTSTLATMVELVASGYTRQAVSWSAPAGSPRVTSNSNNLTFGPFLADPPPVTHCALVSSQTGTSGDFMWSWTAASVIDAIVNDTITVAVGALTMQSP